MQGSDINGIWASFKVFSKKEITLFLEPWAIGWFMKPAEDYYVYLLETYPDSPAIVHVTYHDDLIQIFATKVILYEAETQEYPFEKIEEKPPFLRQSTEEADNKGSWVIFDTPRKDEVSLLLEPSGIRWKMKPDLRYYIYLQEKMPRIPEIHYHDDAIQVFSSEPIVYEEETLLFPAEGTDKKPPYQKKPFS